jgi:hypothetical protein
VALKDALYAVPVVPFGRVVVVIAKADWLTTERFIDCVAVCCGELESATCRAKDAFPACVGMPLIRPVASSDKPAGRLPDLSAQEYGAVPPAAVTEAEYLLCV